ncbi:unnamed protein product [Pedinophyceae sp. YPF-701]|nr:unnamed protein product [Pedinophyceae sp. YPF-701]
MIVICYHYPCPDGIFAALAAHVHFRDAGEPVRYFPLTTYKDASVADVGLSRDDTVYMLDFAGHPGFAQDLCAACARVVVLDHHKTALEALGDPASRPENMEVTFDMDRSGATIARDHFAPKVPETVAAMIRYIEDGDLWRWALAESKPFYAGLRAKGIEYDANKDPGVFETLLRLDPGELIAAGADLMAEEARVVDAHVAAAFVVQLGGARGRSEGWGSCLAVRADGASDLRSPMGNALAAASRARGLRHMGVVAYVEPDAGEPDSIKVSMRSVGPTEDTTVVTKAYGGGGHLNASSCVMSIEEFEAWRVKE